ncbi:uncharacterized protein [Argopecten irradians]|uniref:uncharacterized protein n=1 Tax=Argopecten irradians TaxID=31199 RepID=UPI00371C540A
MTSGMEGLTICLMLLCLFWEARAFEARITKPVDCDRNEVRFHRSHQYLYHYSTAVETSFVGTTASKSAFKLDCEVVVEARRKCEAYLNVTMCSLYHRQPGDEDVYIKDITLSAEITSLLGRELYFQFGRGTIRPHTIVVDNVESIDVLNIKRGILSALQIKLVTDEPGDETHTMTIEDLFGSCPTEYKVESPYKILTSRDITRCQVPHYSYNQNNILSIIKRVYGGYLHKEIDEVIYPFNSTIKCEHTLGESHRLEETTCLQQQQFVPFAREGPEVLTCMTNISQHLILQETRDLLESNVNRKMRDKKSGSLKFEYDLREGETVLVTKVDISHWLLKLATHNDTLTTIPKLFHDFLWILRQAETNDLFEVMADVWNCHGNQGNYCNKKEQKLEQDYFLDGLLSCGTGECINVFTKAMKAGHVNSWLEYVFVYDLALHHESPPEVASSVLEICINRRRGSCWFPLSSMIRNVVTAGGSTVYLESGPVYQTLDHIRETIGDSCVTGIQENLNQDERNVLIEELLLMIKVLGNIGAPAQYVYDSKYTGMEGTTKDQRLVQALLQCAHNTELPQKVAKAAILALHKMTITPKIKTALVGLLSDVNRPPSFRTTVFARLAVQLDRDLITGLVDLIHNERMSYMTNYMVTYVESLLQHDVPDTEELRNLWRDILDADSRVLPHGSHWIKRSKYIELSRYIKLPFSTTFYGLQLEIDTVYNIASPVANAIVVKLNYFAGKKFEFLEFALDIDDFHVLIDAVSEDIQFLQRYFPDPLSSESSRQNTVFATLPQNIAAAILELFDKINLSETKVPDGLIHVKMLGKELFFLEIRELMMTLLQSRSQQSVQHLIMGYFQDILEQLPIHKSSSSSMVDMVKVLPTVAGFPLNMTVSSAISTGLNFDARMTMPDILNLLTDIQLDTTLNTHTAVYFNGELTTRFGQNSLSGARASSSGLLQASLTPSLRFNTQPDPPRTVDISVSHTNTDSKYTMASLSGHLYLMHKSGEIEVQGDPEVQTTVQDCDTGVMLAVTGNQICITSVYPNTTSSSRHAYFPLSGPFSVSLDTRKFETTTFRLSFAHDSNDVDQHIWMNLTREGQENTDGLILHTHKRDRLQLLELTIPKAQIYLYAKEDYNRSSGVTSTRYKVFDVHLSVADKTVNRFLVEERGINTRTSDRMSTITTRNIMDVNIAMSGASLDVTVDSFRNTSNGHYSTACNITYYCTPARPLLYLFHWNPTLAAQNGDVSTVHIFNDAVIGYTNNNTIWRANDYMLLKLPGLKISLDNRMQANESHAKRHTVIAYTGNDDQEHTISMNANVDNSTNATYNSYDYYMLLKHSGMPYNLALRGHLKGVSTNLQILTEIEQVSKSTQESSELDNSDGSIDSDGADPCGSTPGATVMALTLVGESVPEGIEMRWDYNYSRQVCGGQVLYRTTGAFGRQPVNTRRNFHYWLTVDATVTKSRDPVGDQEAVVRSKSYRGNARIHLSYFKVINMVLEYKSELINASGIFHVYVVPKKNELGALFHYQLQTPWPLVNFNIRHFYNYTDHLLHETNVTSAWLDVDTTAHYYITWFDAFRIDLNSTIDSRLPWLPGITNVTGHYEMSDDVLPLVLVALERSEGTINIKADMINTSLNIITVTFQKPGEGVMDVLTWRMELTHTLAVTHSLNWNPNLVHIIRDEAIVRISQLQLALVDAGEEALSNSKKPVMLMVIPFTDMTVGGLLQTYLFPYLRFHLTNGETMTQEDNPQNTPGEAETEPGNTSSQQTNFGDLAFGMMSENLGRALIAIGGANVSPPWIVERVIDHYLRPTMQKIITESRVSVTLPVFGKWRSFLSRPRQTYGVRYLEALGGRLINGAKAYSSDNSARAVVVLGQYLVTYYQEIYHIPDDQAADCIHLLAADFSRERFALLLSRQGISVVTSEMSVMLEFGGNVYRDNCPRPVHLPLGRKDSRIHVYMKREDLILTTTYGVRISCSQRRHVCHIHVDGSHFSHSWGLLGTNDKEKGSDFQLPNKHITSDLQEFIQSYAVGGPPRCFVHGSHDEQARLSEGLLHHGPHALTSGHTRCSTEMANECNRQFTEIIDQYHCDSHISPEQFLDSCLAEANRCGRVAADVCKHIRAYEYVCHLKISYEIIHANCHLENTTSSEGSRRPVDMVLVVDETLGSSRLEIESYVEALLHDVIENMHNVQLGIIGYRGAVHMDDALDPTASTRYMVQLDRLNVSAANSPWRTAWKRFPNVDAMDGALRMASTYPYRLNTQRMVIVISTEEDPYISDELEFMYDNLDIIVNSFGDYESVNPSDKVNGINWDSSVIYRDWFSSYRFLPLPEGRLVDLVATTKGAVFNANTITEKREKRMKFIFKHIKEQINLNNYC